MSNKILKGHDKQVELISVKISQKSGMKATIFFKIHILDKI